MKVHHPHLPCANSAHFVSSQPTQTSILNFKVVYFISMYSVIKPTKCTISNTVNHHHPPSCLTIICYRNLQLLIPKICYLPQIPTIIPLHPTKFHIQYQLHKWSLTGLTSCINHCWTLKKTLLGISQVFKSFSSM
jgi:hypothetical protein